MRVRESSAWRGMRLLRRQDEFSLTVGPSRRERRARLLALRGLHETAKGSSSLSPRERE